MVAIYRYLHGAPNITFLFSHHDCRLVVTEGDMIQCQLMNMDFHWGEKPTVKPRDQYFDTSLVNYFTPNDPASYYTIRKVTVMAYVLIQA